MFAAALPAGSSGDDSDFAAADEAPAPAANVKEIVSTAAQETSSPDHVSASLDGSTEAEKATAFGTMTSRAYQLEMLNQSLKQNVIIVMDTGSGKTQVAVLRIKAELEKPGYDKIIWFLAPTVSLCAQQFEAIRLQVPATTMKLLTGNENVHTWTAGVWETILDCARIVVSTYQVLLNALCHAFVGMDRLALIVLDEAHNCVERHPGSKIITNFYHRHGGRGGSLPAILGLTATPSIRSKMEIIEDLEVILDAKCVSPTRHREELLKCVKKPEIRHTTYGPVPITQYMYTKSMLSFRKAYLGLDISQDPYVLRLQADPTSKNLRPLEKAIEKCNTYSQVQVRGLWSRCIEIYQQLGPWAADLYLWRASQTFLDRLRGRDEFYDHWRDDEKRYVADFLRQAAPQRPTPTPQDSSDISNKAILLLQELLSIEGPVVGIIFAKERATVMMLCELLVSCPRVMEKYRVGCTVGESNYQSRKTALYEFLGEMDKAALQNFRSGKINLLVATAVLEEGIDVPACNLVVCFDNPDTPKSFIQRRGRARMRESKLILITERSSSIIRQWEALEEELKKVYEDEEREVRKMSLLESEPTGTAYIEIESTGALLTFDNAKSHLDHFCKTLSRGEFVESQPDYILERHYDSSPPTLSARVQLPPFVPEDLRCVYSESRWLSEKNATKEAAFRAYGALHRAGLVGDNLLPLKFDKMPVVDARAAEMDVGPLFDPWHLVARAWQTDGQTWLYPLGCYDESHRRTDYEILLPAELEHFRPIQIFLDHDNTCQLRFGSRRPVSEEEAASLGDHTSTLLALFFGYRWPVQDKHHVVRVVANGEDITRNQIGSARFDTQNERHTSGQYLVRDAINAPFMFNGVVEEKPPMEQVQHPFLDYDLAPADEPYLVLTKWSRRSDFLHRCDGDSTTTTTTTTKRYPWVPATCATADEIPAKHAQFGKLIPSVIHELGVMLTAKALATTLLQHVGVSDLGLVREAISARSASEHVNYERLEFLGDSILKYCTSAQAAAEHPEWPEGYLSVFRERLISNSRLSRAALERGLAKFILTRPFTGQKWRPLYLDGYLQHSGQPGKGRRLSTKTLADVVEALIGASYVDGGIPKAIACISAFLRDCAWQDIDGNRDVLFRLAGADDVLPPELEPLEELIGYSFRKKALLIEAMTHGSYALNVGRRSYDRLEFLGDAVLDNIIVTRLFAVEPPLPHHAMHLRKTAMVNGDFLAFMVMDKAMRRSEPVVTGDLQVEEKETVFPMWKFMRHDSTGIAVEQKATAQRYEALGPEIREALAHGTHYPWALLARLQARKFFSDVFEALLGVVWVDSRSLEACDALVKRFGILDYLDRTLRDEVHVLHPKEELGRLAVTETVTYETDAKESGDGAKRYLCRVLVGERVVAEVDDGVSNEEVKTKAAQEAIRLLMAERAAYGGR